MTQRAFNADDTKVDVVVLVFGRLVRWLQCSRTNMCRMLGLSPAGLRKNALGMLCSARAGMRATSTAASFPGVSKGVSH